MKRGEMKWEKNAKGLQELIITDTSESESESPPPAPSPLAQSHSPLPPPTPSSPTPPPVASTSTHQPNSLAHAALPKPLHHSPPSRVRDKGKGKAVERTDEDDQDDYAVQDQHGGGRNTSTSRFGSSRNANLSTNRGLKRKRASSSGSSSSASSSIIVMSPQRPTRPVIPPIEREQTTSVEPECNIETTASSPAPVVLGAKQTARKCTGVRQRPTPRVTRSPSLHGEEEEEEEDEEKEPSPGFADESSISTDFADESSASSHASTSTLPFKSLWARKKKVQTLSSAAELVTNGTIKSKATLTKMRISVGSSGVRDRGRYGELEKELGIGLLLPSAQGAAKIYSKEEISQFLAFQKNARPWNRSLAGPSFPGEHTLFYREVGLHRSADNSIPADTALFQEQLDRAIKTEIPYSIPIRLCPAPHGPYSPRFEIVYTNRVIYPYGVVPEDSEEGGGCTCEGLCDNTSTCECRRRQNAAFDKWETGYGVSPEGFAYDVNGLVKDEVMDAPILECGKGCKCSVECINRSASRGCPVALDLFWTGQRGWGIRVRPSEDGGQRVPRGTPLGIYGGELLSREEIHKRQMKYDVLRRNYLYDIDYWFIGRVVDELKESTGINLRKPPPNRDGNLNSSQSGDSSEEFVEWIVDAFQYGNFTRYCNHNCSPNARVRAVYIDDKLLSRPLHLFVTTRDIEPGEEVTISYVTSESPKLEKGQTVKRFQQKANDLRETAKPADRCYLVSERSIRIFHPILFGLIAVVAIISLAISASLVAHYNHIGYPSTGYRDRIRLLLVAAIWTTIFSIYLFVGVIVASSHILFGIMSHLFTLTIGFLLFLIGAASLTALTDKASCSKFAYDRCNVVKGLVAVSWIETIFLFIALLAVFGLGIKSRSGAGMRKSTLVDA